ncbi:MAG: gliding motility-associated C-terminal domain-containing protein, partial [Bacteroidota bacterium]
VDIPQPGPGFINSYDEAVIGPYPLLGGYSPVVFLPAETGDFSFEFYYPPDNTGTYLEMNRKQITLMDLTVLNAGGSAIDGRVWSKAWQINSGPVEAPPTEQRFYGKMNILSDDSIVTQVDCNGFVGGTFSISSNSTGCSTTGNFVTDRQSREGFHTYPQYKIFLNDPDSNVFPTGTFFPQIILPITVATDCNTGAVDFGVHVTRDGLVEMLIDVNLAVDPDPNDVKIIAQVLANPGGSGMNIIHWNGNNSAGIPVANGTTMQSKLTLISGLTHLPIYDIEYNDGYIVQQVRPKGSQLTIYWDDLLVPGGDASPSTGCTLASGCHQWDSIVGNENTLNSWWYVSRTTGETVPFTILRLPGKPGLVDGTTSVCLGTTGEIYTIPAEPSSAQYTWSYSGSGILITGGGLSVTIDFSNTATSGTLSVYGKNPDCGSGAASSLNITVNPIPVVTLTGTDTVCFNIPDFFLSGGSPQGGTYLVDGIQTTVFQPSIEPLGAHTLVYSYTSPEGCSSSDTSTIMVKNDQECNVLIYFPNAFSPDGNGTNDTFKPFARNIGQFIMEIYTRTGELLFSTDDPKVGWDGSSKGAQCPSGIYIYQATYQVSPVSEEHKTVKGTITISR